MASKSSNKNIVKDTDQVDVDLKFEDDTGRNRTWVDKDRFPEFSADYTESQDNSSLSESSKV